MIPYKSPFATAVPNTLEKRMEIANAIRALASEESEQLRQRRADIAALRRDLELLRRSFPGLIAQAIAEVRRDCDPRLRSYVLKYSPDSRACRRAIQTAGSGRTKMQPGTPAILYLMTASPMLLRSL